MIKFLSQLLLVNLCVLNVQAQLNFVNPEVLELANESDHINEVFLKIENTSDSTLLFDWRYNIPQELVDYVQIYGHDFNMGYTSHIKTSCGLQSPNVLEGNDENGFALILKTIQAIPDEKLHLIDAISLELLASPDCDILLADTNFKLESINSTSELLTRNPELRFNPVDQELWLEHLPVGKINYEIYSVNGQLVQDGTLSNNVVKMEFTAKGLYFLKLSSEETFATVKFLKN